MIATQRTALWPAGIGAVAAGGYVGSIVLANWLIRRYGVVPVGFGLAAPAGVYAAGAALTLRDVTQDVLGKRAVLLAIVAGAVLSAWISPALAVASGVAFLVSELADFAVYTPLRRHGVLAVAASNAVGLTLDSLLFLWLAFGSLDFLGGQMVGKAEATLVALPLVWMWRAGLRLAALEGRAARLERMVAIHDEFIVDANG